MASVRTVDDEPSIRSEPYSPSALVDPVMMFAAQGDQIGQIRRTAVRPLQYVMELAVIERSAAPAPSTGRVERTDRNPLGVGGGSVAAADVDRDTTIVQYDSLQHCVTAEPSERSVAEIDAVTGLCDRSLV